LSSPPETKGRAKLAAMTASARSAARRMSGA